jgi:ABC-type multidrug transport system ATPase subunit
MTTCETLNFYASIILPGSWTSADRKERVAGVLAAMGLKHRQQMMVGGTLPGGLMLRGLSGGERKRLSIAAGILATPSVIFLDEPTSGLDSFAALTVMGYLQRMARDKGHAVIASIHQPRSAIWNMFEKVWRGVGRQPALQDSRRERACRRAAVSVRLRAHICHCSCSCTH